MNDSHQRKTRSRLIDRGLLVGVVSNLGAIGVMLTLISTESGAAIRPMGHTMIAIMFAALGVLIGVPCCLIGACGVEGRRRATGFLGIVLNLTPFPLSVMTLATITLIMSLYEPFLFQESKTLEFPLHWKFPMVNGAITTTLTNELKTMIDKLTIVALVFFLVVQGIIYVIGLLKLAEIRRQTVPNKVKLDLLENEENLFDAGLYCGLGGTVLSLVLLGMGVIKPSLMAAYASTLFGIIFVALLKICHLRPLRRKLIIEAESHE